MLNRISQTKIHHAAVAKMTQIWIDEQKLYRQVGFYEFRVPSIYCAITARYMQFWQWTLSNNNENQVIFRFFLYIILLVNIF